MAADKLDALKAAVSEGRLFDASREDLERFARTVCLPQTYAHFGSAQWPQITETIRLALYIRSTEQAQNDALAISQAALAVAQSSLKVARISLYVSGISAIATILALPPLQRLFG